METNYPSHVILAVKERGDGKKPIWTRIGAIWPNRDGKGFSGDLDLFPVNGKIVIRAYDPAETPDDAQD